MAFEIAPPRNDSLGLGEPSLVAFGLRRWTRRLKTWKRNIVNAGLSDKGIAVLNPSITRHVNQESETIEGI